jgi:predicted dehydrogenase
VTLDPPAAIPSEPVHEDFAMNRKIRVGIIGANPQGSWGTFAHLPALSALPGFEAVAVATAHRSSAEETAARFGIPHAFDDPRHLAEHPDVDVVAVCVRVPMHLQLVTTALDAGKHVYCEWPLGRDTAEARQMLALAQRRGVVHMVGLQARQAPVLGRVRDLIAEGHIGTVRSVSLNHSVDWISKPYPSHVYLNDRSTGAHFLSIPGGHSIDAVCWLLGEFSELSATVKTQLPDIEVIGTGETIRRTSADQVLVNGVLQSGVVASIRLSGATSAGTGIRLEINGDKGDLVVTAAPGARGIQMSDLRLFETKGMGELAELEIPERYFGVPLEVRKGPPLNVACAYLQLADAIEGRAPASPDFATSVQRHQTLDTVEQSAAEGRRLSL